MKKMTVTRGNWVLITSKWDDHTGRAGLVVAFTSSTRFRVIFERGGEQVEYSQAGLYVLPPEFVPPWEDK